MCYWIGFEPTLMVITVFTYLKLLWCFHRHDRIEHVSPIPQYPMSFHPVGKLLFSMYHFDFGS